MTYSHPYPAYPEDIAYCRNVHKKYGKSFYFGTLIMDAEEHDATCVLYAFFRIPDEYVDTYYKDQSDKALAKINAWQQAWRAYYAAPQENESADTASHTDPLAGLDEAERRVLCATKHIFKTYSIPFQCSEDFIAAMIQDTHTLRYETYKELAAYMHGSAGVVGVMMTYIMCSKDRRFASDEVFRKDILSTAHTLGLAFQMTNFLRDIGADLDERGRIYLPQEDIRRFGLTDQHLKDKVYPPAFDQLMKFEIDRTDALYEIADEGIYMLPQKVGRAIYIARVLYSKIITKIEREEYRILSKRVSLSFLEKVYHAGRAILTFNAVSKKKSKAKSKEGYGRRTDQRIQ